MKINKHVHLLMVLMFLFQVLFPPALLAQKPPADTAATARSVDELFDENISIREKQLLFEFIQYVANSFAPREALRKASEELHRTLEKDKFWFSVDIKDPEMAELMAEANSGRRYLLEKTAPIELRLHAEQRRLEKQILADHEKIVATGTVPDGFMERNRDLASLYDRQDELWAMKIARLFEIGTLTNNVITNYLAEHPEAYVPIKEKIDRSNAEMDAMAGFAAHHNQRILALKARYQEAQNAYDGATAAALAEDRANTQEMIRMVDRQSKSLKARNEANAGRHAELLAEISWILEDRIVRIDQQLGQIGASEAFPNPFYVAPGLGSSEESRELAERYRGIAKQFIAQTQEKTNEIQKIKTSLDDIKRAMGQEQIFFQTMVSDASGFSPEKQRDITEKSGRIIAGFTSKLTLLNDTIDRILGLSAGLDFANPDRIIGSQPEAAKAFRINHEIENFLAAAKDIDQDAVGVSLRLYALVAEMDMDRASQLQSFEMLENASAARANAVESFTKNIAGLQDLYQADAGLAGDFKRLGRDIISQGQKFYTEKTRAVTDLLTKAGDAAKTPYGDFLTGVTEQLRSRLRIIDQMITVSKAVKLPDTGTAPCPDCPDPASVWPELSDLGTAYTDTLNQLDDLADIESFFGPEKIAAEDRMTAAKNLFALNKRLGNEPYLHLNPDSIDVVFIAGSRMVAVKGIGDPTAVDFNLSAIEGTDHLTQPPYIGGWLSSAVSKVGSWVKPVGQAIANTASSVVSSASQISGKISTAIQTKAQNIFNGAKKVISTVGEYGSAAIDATKVWAVNTWENAFMNEDGSYSWLKIGGYALGGAACAIAAVGTAGLAAPACIALAIGAGVNIAQGGVDTAKDYGYISKSLADKVKIGLDILGIVGGGLVNRGAAIAAGKWANMGKLQKALVLMGVDPDNLKDIGKWRETWDGLTPDMLSDIWKNVKNISKVKGLEGLVDHLGAWRNVPDWYYKFKDWYGMLPPGAQDALNTGLTNALPGLGTFYQGSQLLNQLLGPNFQLPGIQPYPYSIGLDPFSPFGMGPFMTGIPGISGGGAGVHLPGTGPGGGGGASGGGGAGAGWGGGTGPGGAGPGVTLGPGGQAPGGQWTITGQGPSDFVSPYKDWENPYDNWVSPYKGWKSPFSR